MSAKDVLMMHLNPISLTDHGACSLELSHPKLSPAIRIDAFSYPSLFSTKSGHGAMSAPIVATSLGFWYRSSVNATKPSPVHWIALRNYFGMIMLVSMFWM